MEGLKRQIRFQLIDSKKSFIIFWAIVILVNILGYFVNCYYDVRFGMMSSNGVTHNVNVAGGNMVAISIFLIVSCMVMYYESFPTAITFSSTRRDFYKGVLVHNCLLSLAMALIQGILLKIDPIIVTAIGLNPLGDMGYINLNNNIIFLFIMLFLYFIWVCGLFNLIGSLNYRFGYKIWIIMLGLLMIGGNLNVLKEPIEKLMLAVFQYENMWTYLLKVIALTVVFYALTWVNVRKLNIRSGK